MINPGIRRVVQMLRDSGFPTSDSGDGVTNVEAGMEGALTIPHVHCVYLDTNKAVKESHRLMKLLRSKGLISDAVSVVVVYSPRDKLSTLSLYGLSDAALPEETEYEKGWNACLKAAVARLNEEVPDKGETIVCDPVDWLKSIISIISVMERDLKSGL